MESAIPDRIPLPLGTQLREALAHFRRFRDRVLETQTHPNTIRLFRAVVSVWVILNTLMLLPAAEHFWSAHSYVPVPLLDHASPWDKALNLLSFDAVAPYYLVFVGMQVLAAVFAGLSIAPRLSSLALYFFTMNLDNRAAVILDGGNNLIHILLFLLIFMTPCAGVVGNAFSNAAFFMARLQVAMLYATAGLLKVHGELWTKGVALYYTMNVLEYGNRLVGELMAASPVLLAAGSFATVLFQVTFPILIWPRVTRPLLMAAGTLFHLAIVFVMGLTSFGFAMCASYFVFYTDAQAARVLGVFRRRVPQMTAFNTVFSVPQPFKKGSFMFRKLFRPARARVLGLTLATAVSLNASARPQSYGPKPMLPSETGALLQKIEAEGSAPAMTRFLTPEVTQAIRDYAKLDDLAVRRDPTDPYAATPAAAGAGLVAGAVASVVEHVWDKYVGNGRLAAGLIDERDFDLVKVEELSPYPSSSLPVFDGPRVIFHVGERDPRHDRHALVTTYPQVKSMVQYNSPTTTEFVNQYRAQAKNLVLSDPRASWAVIVAEAAAAAVGYKAAEYALNKAGAKTVDWIRSMPFDERSFDLR